MKNLNELGGWMEGYKEGWDDAFKTVIEIGEILSKDTGKFLKERMEDLGLVEK